MIGILSRSRYQYERYAQWEKWAEVTLGHTRTVREIIHKTAMGWSDDLLLEWVTYI